MDDLVAWLRQQLDEDERAIQDLTRPVTEPLLSSRRDVHEWILESSPKRGVQRVRREVEAKRLHLALHKDCDAGCYVVKVLALPYADRPGYREEWKP